MAYFRKNNEIPYRKYPQFIWRRSHHNDEQNVDAIYGIGDKAPLSEEVGVRDQDGYPEGHDGRVHKADTNHVPEQHLLDNLEEESGIAGRVRAHARELRPF